MMPATMDDAVASGSGSGSADDAARRDVADRPGLPYGKACVVQFAAETDGRLQHATGRVEHLQSGRRARFGSTAELFQRIIALLRDDRTHTTQRGEPAARKGGDR